MPPTTQKAENHAPGKAMVWRILDSGDAWRLAGLIYMSLENRIANHDSHIRVFCSRDRYACLWLATMEKQQPNLEVWLYLLLRKVPRNDVGIDRERQSKNPEWTGIATPRRRYRVF